RRHTIFSRDWSSDVCSSDLCCVFGYKFCYCFFHGTCPFKRFHQFLIFFSISEICGINLLRDFQSEDVALPPDLDEHLRIFLFPRSEERRVGKEYSSTRLAEQ